MNPGNDKGKQFIFLIRVITKLPNSEQSYKGKVKTHNYINRQNQSTTGKAKYETPFVFFSQVQNVYHNSVENVNVSKSFNTIVKYM